MKQDNKTILNEGDINFVFMALKCLQHLNLIKVLYSLFDKNKKIKKQLDMFKNFAFETEISVMGPWN